MLNTRNQLDKIIITAMDRFVWFILLVVMSHVVTEFTRVTGYARGPRHDIILINDTMLEPRQVQNLVYYPGQEYGIYDAASASGQKQQQQANAALINGAPAGSTNADQQGFFSFSFRPLIDSIFDIPISTLRAVNNLVARLTGSFQQAPVHAAHPQKVTAAAVISRPGLMMRSATGSEKSQASVAAVAAAIEKPSKKLMREEMA